MNFISRNVQENIPLEEVAREASFSTYHFHRIFKAVVGETVAEFTRRIRLEAAANHLIFHSQTDITSIAIDFGFSSSQNFAKAFRIQFGQSPTEFRESKIGNTPSKQGNASPLHLNYDAFTELKESANSETLKTMNAEIKEMPEHHVAFVRKVGPYGPEVVGAAFGELMQWAAPKGLVGPGTLLGVYWDNPEITPPDKCRTDACVQIPKEMEPTGQVAVQTLPGGPHAVCRAEVTAQEFKKAWEDAYVWLTQSGREPGESPCYEVYYNNAEEHPEKKWIVDICIPLKA